MTFMENLYKLVVSNIMCILQSFFILKRMKLLITISRIFHSELDLSVQAILKICEFPATLSSSNIRLEWIDAKNYYFLSLHGRFT